MAYYTKTIKDHVYRMTGKTGFSLLLFMLCLGVTASAQKYVKVTATGTGTGTNWDNALGASSLKTTIQGGGTIYIAAGTYIPTAVTAPAGTTIQGGFPASATGTDISGYDPASNQTIIDGNLGRVLDFGSGTNVLKGIVITNSKGGGTGGSCLRANAGGLMYSWKIEDCIFKNTTGNGADCAVWLNTGGNTAGNLTIKNCIFDNNVIIGGAHGSALRLDAFMNAAQTNDGASFMITGCSFRNNSATGGSPGGALEIGTNRGLNFINCSFCGNYSDNYGGAITSSDGDKLIFDGCSFTGNSNGAEYGGAVRFTGSDSIVIKNSVFTSNTNNYSLGAGGAIAIESDSPYYITNTNFYNNTTRYRGGAIVFQGGGAMAVANCIFKGNSVTAGITNYGGGAVYTISGAGQAVTYTNSTFDSNTVVGTSTNGGAIGVGGGVSPSATGCTFYNNSNNASTTALGSDIFVYGGGTFTASSSSLQATQATYTASYNVASGNTFSNTTNPNVAAAPTITCPTSLTPAVIGSFDFNCAGATSTGSFAVNGGASQSGTLIIPITNAVAGSVTLTVTATGFTGAATVNLTAGQTSITVPITYNGSGSAGSRTLTVTSAQGTGSCTPSVTVAGAPPSPGGVGNNLATWLKADAGISSADGAAVINWTDQSISNYSVTQATATNQPLVYKTTANKLVNFNPSVYFDGVNDYLLNSNPIFSGTSPFSFMMVGLDESTDGGYRKIFGAESPADYFGLYKVTGATTNNGWTEYTVGNNFLKGNGYAPTGGASGYWNGTAYVADSRLQVAQPQVVGLNSANPANTNPSTMKSFIDGYQSTATFAGITAYQNQFFKTLTIGGETGAEYWKGRIPEFIAYSAQLSDVQTQQVNTYLAIKYGVTLGQGGSSTAIGNNAANYDYIATDGTTKVWDATANSTYKYDITGIGRDDAEGLNQKQSKSVNATAYVTISNGSTVAVTNAANTSTFAADKSYEVYGDNGLATSYATAYTPTSFTPAAPFYLMSRIWKIQETGTVGTVTISVPVGPERLLVSSSAAFGAGTQEILLTADGNGNMTAQVDFTDGQFFTFGKALTAPGGVTANLNLWLKADAINGTDGSKVASWSDAYLSSYGVSQATVSQQPTLYKSTADNLVNFNPSVKFTRSASNVMNNTTASPLGSSAIAFHFIAVAKDQDPTVYASPNFGSNSLRGILGNGLSGNNPAMDLQKDGAAWNGWNPWTDLTGEWNGGKATLYNGGGVGTSSGTGTLALPSAYTDRLLNQQPQVFGLGYTAGAATKINSWVDGFTEATTLTDNNATYVGNNNFRIGDSGGGEYWNGTINEVLAYTRELTNLEMQKINTYLAIKYGVTLGQGNNNVGLNSGYNYIATDGTTTLWNTTTNAGYNNDIAVIGRDDAEALMQKQSKSVNAGFQPTVSIGAVAVSNQANTGSFGTDKTFEAWGNNGLTENYATLYSANSFTPSVPTSFYAMNRVWKVQETGTIGTVTIRVPTGPERLLVFPAGTTVFSSGATKEILMVADGNGNMTATVDFANGELFTFGRVLTAPGCVTSGLQVWLKADVGTSTTTNGTKLTQWNDQSGNGKDHKQTDTNYQPIFKTNGGFNNYPAVTFDGSDIMRTAAYASGNEAVHVFAMSKVSDAGWRSLYGMSSNITHVQWLNNIPSAYLLGNRDYNGAAQPASSGFGITSFILPKDASQQTFRWNGVSSNTTLPSGTKTYTYNTGSFGVGGDDNETTTTEAMLGDIQEIIVYKTGTPSVNGGAMATTDIQKIESYLGIKYGITLVNNYLSGSGKTIYDVSTYPNNVFGIGRDDCQSLNHKQSQSVSSNKMTIGLADSISTSNATHPAIFNQDSSFIIIGDNGLTGVVTPSVSGACPPPPSADKASAQIFKVVETGSVQSIKILFNPSGLGYNNLYPVYMQVATDAAFTSLVANVPMIWSGANVATNYNFPANTTVYVRFMGNTTSLANICTASKAQTFYFNGWNYGTKTKDIIANYATSATTGDMVMKTTVTDGTPNVLLYRPTHDWWPVYDGYGLFYPRYGSSATENSTITTKIEFLSQATTGAANASTTKLAAQTANFMIWDLDGYIGSRDIVKVYGKLSGQNVDAKLTRNQYTALGLNHGGDPQSVIGGVAPWDLSYWGRLYVTFESPVEEIYIEYKQDATYAFNTYQDFRIGPITATCKAPTPKVITPDNVYIYKEVASPVKSGDVATYKFTIQNLNCGDKTINFSDILPNGSGLTWADSTVSTSLAIGSTNTYGNTRTLTLNNVTVPAGTSYIYVDAKTSTAGTYNNQATYTVGANNYVSDDPSVTGANSPTALTIIANDPEANLTITKAVDKATAGQNEILTYTYTITNPNGSAINTTLQDQLPADASGNTPTFVASSLTGIGSALVSTYAGAASLTIRNLSIPANGSLTVTIQANTGTYTVGDTIKNIISIVPDVAAGYRLTTKYSGSANTKIGASCAAGTTAPNLATTTLTNVCPATSANLASIAVGNKPSGTVMTWHTGTPATSSNKVADSTSVTAGTYYAVFYDAAFNCYSGATSGAATTAVTVTLDVCPANITVSNVCPATTVDLTTRFSGTVPSGKVVTWHTGLPTTTANKVANPAAVVAGTYYAAFYDSVNDCYSPGSPNGIVVTITTCVTCVAGSAAPSVPATKSNACPLTTVDLSSITAANQPANTTLSWHTGTPANSTNILTGTTSVGASTYYAAFYDAAANCFSTATTAVTVTITTCITCEAGYSKPTLSATTKSNTCPITTANLGTITSSYLPVGTTLSWHSATPATLANKVADSSAVAAGTYYAAFYDKVNGCFSGNGDSTTAVVVTINSCATPDLITTIGQPTPALVAGQTSNLPVKVTNIGGVSATGPITTTVTLPTGVSAPATFTTNSSTCSTSGQTVTCTNAGPIAANDSIVMNIPITPNASLIGTTPTFNATVAPVAGETNTSNNAATPTTATTPVAGVPDLTTTIGQPTPALVVGQASNVPITIKNIGTGSAPGIITTTMTLPTGTSAPATFTSNGSTCSTSGQTVTCTNAGPIAAGDSIKILVPVTPNASIVGTNPTFNATTSPVTGETNTGNNTATPMTTTAAVTASTVKVSAKVFLSGSYVTLAGMMHDSLRVKGLIPSAQPYGSIGYTGTETVAPSVLTVTGANAIVDWVLVELRSDATTVVTKRAGLVQRDGDIVDTDGVTPLTFTAASGSYYVVVRHRNHLGVMSGSAIALTPTTTTVDFTSILTTNYQISGAFGSVYAQRTLGAVRGLWGGNTGGGVSIKATGSGSDAEAVYFKVLLDAGNTNFSPSYIIYNIYAREDASMDGKIIYQGTGSEIDGILFNVLLHLNNAGVLPTFVIYEQIP